MKTYLIKIIEKYKNHYPAWLELWLIRHKWLYPEPKQYQIMNAISDSMLMRTSSREMGYEIKNKMINQLWEAIEQMYQKYNYAPDLGGIDVSTRENFEDYSRIITIRLIARYRPYRSFGYMSDLIGELNKVIRG